MSDTPTTRDLLVYELAKQLARADHRETPTERDLGTAEFAVEYIAEEA